MIVHGHCLISNKKVVYSPIFKHFFFSIFILCSKNWKYFICFRFGFCFLLLAVHRSNHFKSFKFFFLFSLAIVAAFFVVSRYCEYKYEIDLNQQIFIQNRRSLKAFNSSILVHLLQEKKLHKAQVNRFWFRFHYWNILNKVEEEDPMNELLTRFKVHILSNKNETDL